MDENDSTLHCIKSFLDNDYNSVKSNLEILLKDYKRKSKRLDTIMNSSDKQQLQPLKI